MNSTPGTSESTAKSPSNPKHAFFNIFKMIIEFKNFEINRLLTA